MEFCETRVMDTHDVIPEIQVILPVNIPPHAVLIELAVYSELQQLFQYRSICKCFSKNDGQNPQISPKFSGLMFDILVKYSNNITYKQKHFKNLPSDWI